MAMTADAAITTTMITTAIAANIIHTTAIAAATSTHTAALMPMKRKMRMCTLHSDS